MRFRLVDFLYLFAFVAAALTIYGDQSFAATMYVVICWLIVGATKQPTRERLANWFIAIGVMATVVWLLSPQIQ